MTTAFVTGGGGFIGLNLIEQLLEQEIQVTALVRGPEARARLAALGVATVHGDITKPESLSAAIPLGVDVVFHVAANTSPWRLRRKQQDLDNIDGTANVVAAALQAGAKRFIQTSTWNVYGLWQGEISEAIEKLGHQSWLNYDRSKYAGEQIVLQAVAHDGLDAVIVNPAHVIGRYDRHNWARMFQLVDLDKLPGAPPGAGTFADGRAVAAGHIAAWRHGRTGENYILGGHDASFLEVLTIIGELLGRPIPKRPLPASVIRFFAHMANGISFVTRKEPRITPEAAEITILKARAVSAKAERELGYRSPPLRDMLTDCHAWLEAEGLIGV